MRHSPFLDRIGPRLQLIFCLLACSTYSSGQTEPSTAPRHITIATQISYGNERALFAALLNEFDDQQPSLTLTIQYYRGDISHRIEQWVNDGTGPEVIYWYAGSHIDRLARAGKLSNLKQTWQNAELDNRFSAHAKDAVTYQQSPYGIPISYYPWGLYYRASIFEELKLKPPKTWHNILQNCADFRAHNKHLLAIGTKDNWPSLIWFDYLSLRLYGLEFYRQLLAGEKSWDSIEVKNILSHWKQLLDAQCFDLNNHQQRSVAGVLPQLYHKHSAMTLTGAYSLGNLAAALKFDFRLLSFPTLNPAIPDVHVAPVDAFVVPNYANIDTSLTTLLNYLADSDFQISLNEPSSRLPANLTAQTLLIEPLQTESIALLDKGRSSQYFDRESHPDLALVIAEVLVGFIDSPDIDLSAKQLQAAFNAFIKKHPNYQLEH